MDRLQFITQLLQREEIATANYVSGETDRDTWTKEIKELDERLSILGIRLTSLD